MTDKTNDELLTAADELIKTWDQKGSWSPDSPIGMVMQLSRALKSSETERREDRADMARDTEQLLNKLADAQQQAAELAAVVEQERMWWDAVRADHAEDLMLLRDASLRRLAAAPMDALDRVREDERNRAAEIVLDNNWALGPIATQIREQAS